MAGAVGGTIDHLAEKAATIVERGFPSLKFNPFPSPWRVYIDGKTEESAVDRVRAIRKVVGPDIDILVGVHRRLAPMYAVRVAPDRTVRTLTRKDLSHELPDLTAFKNLSSLSRTARPQ
jgi:L-alanine-DL-glutamate epimerase-like enolase superfamily enzyme